MLVHTLYHLPLRELLAQSLSIAVTPWPRAPDAPETYTSGEVSLDHPFAGLAALKRQPPK